MILQISLRFTPDANDFQYLLTKIIYLINLVKLNKKKFVHANVLWPKD
jgi:hypothetical protein